MASTHAIFTEYDWDTFMSACETMNSTEFYRETYPLLGEYCDEFGITPVFYETFLQKALAEGTYTYQDCLTDMVNMLLEGNRYACEGIENIYPAMETCLKNGARFPEVDQLFLHPTDSTLEDAVADHHVRAALMDRFHEAMDATQTQSDWSAIEACDWEGLEDPQNTMTNRARNLKSRSTYLLTTYPNPTDKPYTC